MQERGQPLSPSDVIRNSPRATLSIGSRGSVPTANRPLDTRPDVTLPGMPPSHACRGYPVSNIDRIPANETLIAQTKLALRRLASAVAIVTCRDGQTRHAMTATAVNAMSMQPPSMVVCVNRSGAFHAAISRAENFAINMLHRNQVQVSMDCGGKARGEDRFSFGGWSEEHGTPVLPEAQARIVCAREGRLDYGSHSIFVGRVISVGIHGVVDPLIYVDGQYASLTADGFFPPEVQSQIEAMCQLAMG
jgi:flavin reductase (DIM6/NTAB) family NADH-FMN oxidoreductase RutF